MGSLLAQLIPTAIVGALAPLPIIIVVTLLMAKGGLGKAVGFGGAFVAVFAVIGIIALATSSGGSHSGSKGSAITGTILAVLGVLFVLTAVKLLVQAPDPDAPPPKFMTALDSMSVGRAAVLGVIGAIVGYVAAPDWASRELQRFRGWLVKHNRVIGIVLGLVIGAWFIIWGVTQIA